MVPCEKPKQPFGDSLVLVTVSMLTAVKRSLSMLMFHITDATYRPIVLQTRRAVTTTILFSLP